MNTSELIAAYWSTPEIVTNIVILLHLAGALMRVGSAAVIRLAPLPPNQKPG